jgi:recombination protein RecT
MTSVADLRKGKKTPMKNVMELPPKQRIATLLQENKAEIMAALPKHISIDRMLTIAQTAAVSVPQLLDCFTPSLFGAMIKCSQLGLEPNNALGQAYLIPFRNNKKNRTDVQLLIGYRGMIDLARRSGHIKSIQAQAVREGDEFEFEWGTQEKLRHVPGQNRGEITHFYAYAQLKDGGVQFDVLTKGDVDKIMSATQSKGNYGPWKDHYEQMGRKTLVRRLFNYLPVSIEMAEAAGLDSRADGGVDQGMDAVLTGEYTVMPEQDAPQIEEPQQEEEEEPPVVDENGEVFDAKLHASDGDGLPVFNKDGSFRRKPQRGKPAAEPKPEEPLADQPGMSHAIGWQEQQEPEQSGFGGDEEENFEIE